MKLKDKVAIVTGAASGLGKGIATKFAAAGAKVVLADLNLDGAKELQRIIGDSSLAVELDVASESSWQQGVAATLETYGQLDILVNCAGVMIPGDIETTDFQTWNTIMSVNAGGVFLGCQNAIKAMRQSGNGGAIVNIASTSALRTPSWVTAYGTSKAAAVQLTRAVALHCATKQLNIRCNAIAPGAVLTPMVEGMLSMDPNAEDTLAALERQHPLGRLATPEDVANTALFLASDDAAYLTGVLVPVDGGATISA